MGEVRRLPCVRAMIAFAADALFPLARLLTFVCVVSMKYQCCKMYDGGCQYGSDERRHAVRHHENVVRTRGLRHIALCRSSPSLIFMWRSTWG